VKKAAARVPDELVLKTNLLAPRRWSASGSPSTATPGHDVTGRAAADDLEDAGVDARPSDGPVRESKPAQPAAAAPAGRASACARLLDGGALEELRVHLAPEPDRVREHEVAEVVRGEQLVLDQLVGLGTTSVMSGTSKLADVGAERAR